jgi:hypothetical protein
VQLKERLEIAEAQRKSDEQQLTRERARSAGLENQLAQNRPAPMLGFILSPGLVRGADGQRPLRIPADAGTVRLQFDVKRTDGYKTYRAEIQTLDGTRVFSQDSPAPVIEIPARVLAADDYVVALKGITTSGATEGLGEYYFTVVRR